MDSHPCCSAWSGLLSVEEHCLRLPKNELLKTIDQTRENSTYRCENNDDCNNDEEDEKFYQDPFDAESFFEAAVEFDTIRRFRSRVIDPPAEFRDTPPSSGSLRIGRQMRHVERKRRLNRLRAYTPSPPPIVAQENFRNQTLRSSSSHNSLQVPSAINNDDSNFIKSAVSHDALTDLYNVPIDGDIYSLPFDNIKPTRKHRHIKKHHRHKRRRHTSMETNQSTDDKPLKRNSSPGPESSIEPIHMTLQEVRHFLHTLYNYEDANQNNNANTKHHRCHSANNDEENMDLTEKNRRDKIQSDNCNRRGQKQSLSYLLKQAICNIFKSKRASTKTNGGAKKHFHSTDDVLVISRIGFENLNCEPDAILNYIENNENIADNKMSNMKGRALPPLPPSPHVPTLTSCNEDEGRIDFAASLEKVKDCGWYWGPISGEAAEKVLRDEPDGSFIVRDSSDHHYIFSLTFRLNGNVRHVRIEHDQGNFSFGSYTKFKCHTIVDFIETAVEHSRSGRYLFFLHRRPVLGPMRVQLLHPVSRFKHVQSLQHLCRFIIVKSVRRDLILKLPLPQRLLDYLNSPYYYSELLADHQDQRTSTPPPIHLLSFAPPN